MVSFLISHCPASWVLLFWTFHITFTILENTYSIDYGLKPTPFGRLGQIILSGRKPHFV
jgi:hypothetical protein